MASQGDVALWQPRSAFRRDAVRTAAALFAVYRALTGHFGSIALVRA